MGGFFVLLNYRTIFVFSVKNSTKDKK